MSRDGAPSRPSGEATVPESREPALRHLELGLPVKPGFETLPSRALRIHQIDWGRWEAKDPATLVFIVRDGQVLLIRKKRGLGAGKINGPGGRFDPGERPRECAAREIEEELEIRPTDMHLIGENKFQFVHGYSIHVFVYRAEGYEGEPTETEEAVPIWSDVASIPYEEMWEDDVLWIPHLLAGRTFRGCFVFEDDQMLDGLVEVDVDLGAIEREFRRAES